MPEVTSTLFIVRGSARGKGRPRFARATGHVHTPQATKAAEARVHEAWAAAGGPDLGDGPLALALRIYVDRPSSHRKVRGGLTSLGDRTPFPTKTPDLDNVLKLVADALNQRAYRDDKQIVTALVERRWTPENEREHMVIALECRGGRTASLTEATA